MSTDLEVHLPVGAPPGASTCTNSGEPPPAGPGLVFQADITAENTMIRVD